MQYLYKIFHQYDHFKFKELYEKRLSTDTLTKFDLKIKPMNQPEIYELFYIPTNEMINKVAEIYRISGELNSIFNDLPTLAKDQFIMECLIEELYNTNELEGVQSTKKEIAKSVRNVKLKKKNKKRFNSMIVSYMNVISGDKSLPVYPENIRKIYDEITEGEIEKEELPDGKIFRKDITQVLKKSGSQKVIHRGVIPEENIIEEIKKMLEIMNNNEEIPTIIKIAIGHYYFGYIHPFYDGNGRTSRFISSIFLSKTLGKIPSLSLSRGSNKMKNSYLDSFEVANSLMSRGEMNHFIDTFLDIIYKTLSEMNGELKEKIELIEIASNKLKNDKRIKNENEMNFMFILAQNNFFDYNDGLTVKELAKNLKLSEATTRKTAKDLLDKSLIKQTGLRPAYFYIDTIYFERE